MTDPANYKSVMRNLSSGVTIVTTMLEGTPFGMTVTSFIAVSLDPMLVVVSLEKGTRTHGAVSGSGVFGVNILGADDIEIAKTFAVKAADRFNEIDYQLGDLGVPILPTAVGVLECRVAEEFPGGDHTLFLGEVEYASSSPADPLIYFQGSYRKLGPVLETTEEL